jgi:hypothetical protein
MEINLTPVLVYFKYNVRTMSTNIGSKINRLPNSQPQGIVLLSSWLAEQGYSYDLRKYNIRDIACNIY